MDDSSQYTFKRPGERLVSPSDKRPNYVMSQTVSLSLVAMVSSNSVYRANQLPPPLCVAAAGPLREPHSYTLDHQHRVSRTACDNNVAVIPQAWPELECSHINPSTLETSPCLRFT